MQATNYFKNFNYTISNEQIITNLLNRVKIKDVGYILKTKVYLPYFIKDGDRPETIAEEYYGSTSYFWIILFANDIKNIYEDWPRTQEALDEYITYKYKTLEEATSTTHHYEDEYGNHVTGYAGNNLLVMNDTSNDEITGIDYRTFSVTPVTYYEYESNLNESKRIINLIRPQYVTQIATEFQKIFK